MREKTDYSASDNLLRVLSLLGRRGRLRVTEASEELGVSTSAAHRYLTILRANDYASQRPGHPYEPGPALLALGLSRNSTRSLVQRIHPHLEWLSSELSETVHVIVMNGRDAQFVDSIESPQYLRIGSRVGVTLPATRTSGGKAILARLDEGTVRALHQDGVDSRGDSVDIDKLVDELAEVRRRGYGENYEESGQGIVALGMALVSKSGDPFAAVSVSVPSVRASPDLLTHILRCLAVATDRIHRELGEGGAHV